MDFNNEINIKLEPIQDYDTDTGMNDLDIGPTILQRPDAYFTQLDKTKKARISAKLEANEFGIENYTYSAYNDYNMEHIVESSNMQAEPLTVPPKDELLRCDKLNVSTGKKYILKQHIPTHEEDAPAYNISDFCCASPQGLTHHMQAHKQDAIYKCPDHSFTSPKEIRLPHLLVNPVYKCNQCNFSSNLKTKYENHLFLPACRDKNKNQENVIYECDKCSFTTLHKSILAAHLETHKNVFNATTQDVIFKCCKCKSTFPQKELLEMHLKTHVREIYKHIYRCNKCNFTTKRKIVFDRHLQSQHVSIINETNVYKCRICNYFTKNKKKFVKHSLKHPKREKTIYKCNKCSFSCAHINTLKLHEKKHSDKKFSCDNCHFSTVYKNSLVYHMMSHTGKKIKCEKCDFLAVHKNHLKSHIRSTHMQVKPFKCTICNFTTVYKNSLAYHLKTHLGKDYKCDFCGYLATHKEQLIQHIRSIHTKEKPYKCTKCNFKSSYKNSIGSHMITHRKKSIRKNLRQKVGRLRQISE